MTKDDSLRVKSIRDIKSVMEGLPFYLNIKSKKDTYNTEQISVGAFNNVYHTAVARSSEVDAASIGRGLTVACHRIDEFAFIKNIEVTLSSLMPTATKARENAKKNNLPYGNIFTTTAGYLNTREGEYGFKVYNECIKWRETLFDCKNLEQLEDTIKKNCPSRTKNVLLEMNHRQLGKTDDWLRENIRVAMLDGERAEAEFLNAWSRGNESCPISKEMLEVIHNSVVKDPYTWISKYGFIVNWFLPLKEVKSRQLVVGLDTSDAIGNDDIAMNIRDPYTGEVVGSGLFNETNILTFSEFLIELFLEFDNIAVMIIERKSTGSSIIDNLIKMLPMHGLDPFKKLFNWVVNNAQEKKEYMTEVINKSLSARNPDVYIKYKKEFGYATSATGRSSRDNLYGAAFSSAIKYTGKYVRDEILARQLAGLVRRNGRIDHKPGEHDDMCVAFMMNYWILTNGNNLSYYGLNSKMVLSSIAAEVVKEEGGPEKIIEKENQNVLMEQVYKILDQIKAESNPILTNILVNKVKHLTAAIDDTHKVNFNLEAILDEIKMKKRKYYMN